MTDAPLFHVYSFYSLLNLRLIVRHANTDRSSGIITQDCPGRVTLS